MLMVVGTEVMRRRPGDGERVVERRRGSFEAAGDGAAGYDGGECDEGGAGENEA